MVESLHKKTAKEGEPDQLIATQNKECLVVSGTLPMTVTPKVSIVVLGLPFYLQTLPQYNDPA